MKRSSLHHLDHGVAHALEVVGEWWTIPVIWAIREESHRFEELQQKLGIARNILSDRLGTLVSAGVVEKRQYSHRPPRFEYHLTDMGTDLHGVLSALEGWGNKWCRPGQG